MIPLDAVKKLLPKSHGTMLSQDFLDRVEASIADKEIADTFKDNFISYLNVLAGGRYKMTDYISAVKFISYKLLGYTDTKAYISTFPERYERIKDKEYASNFISMYSKNKLVNQIYEQTMVPTYVLNAPLHQQALNELASMIKDPSIRGMAKVKACETILNYTKPPEVVKGEITIGVEQQETISELREVTENLAKMYRQTLERGNVKLEDIANNDVITVDYKEKKQKALEESKHE